MPRDTPPRSMMDVVAVTGGSGDDGDAGLEVDASGDDGSRGEWGRAEHSGRTKRDMNSQRATLSNMHLWKGSRAGKRGHTCADSGVPPRRH